MRPSSAPGGPTRSGRGGVVEPPATRTPFAQALWRDAPRLPTNISGQPNNVQSGPTSRSSVTERRRSVDLLRRRVLISESVAESGQFVFGPTKTHAQRTVPLPPSLVERLSEHLDRLPADAESLLFTSLRGDPMRYANFRRRIWRPTLECLGLPMVGVHVLRHSAAARLIAAGASPKAVQTILGHGSAAFTLTVYGHLVDTDLDDLADRLDVTTGVRRGARTGPRSIGWRLTRKHLSRDLRERWWGGQDLNLRPTDYESTQTRSAPSRRIP